jgi:hypothetical protein
MELMSFLPFLRGNETRAQAGVRAVRGRVFLSGACWKILEKSAQIAPENYPPFAVSPRDQISGGDGLIKPCATNAGHRAGFRDRKSFAD